MNWKFSDFPKEPNGINNTILHVIERSYAYFCAGQGYYPAYIMSDRYSTIEFNNLNDYLNTLVNTLTRLGIGYDRFEEFFISVINKFNEFSVLRDENELLKGKIRDSRYFQIRQKLKDKFKGKTDKG
jgi:rhamnosyltransferase